jgi:hypothetical protein
MGNIRDISNFLHYNPDNGNFYHKRAMGRGKKGEVVTSLDSHGYIRVSYKGKRYSGHRIAWLLTYGYLPECDIDHINGIRDDNRISNLRLATRGQNLHNQKCTRGKSRFKGVVKHKSGWVAQLGVVNKYVGIYLSEEEAALAYNHRSEVVFGKFSRYNQVFEDVSVEVLHGEA